ELPSHPWFIGCQFHPELQSRPLRPHPLFAGFVAAADRHRRADVLSNVPAGHPEGRVEANAEIAR
ncbi:MAG: hypothetical protein ABMA00_18825, partial [Gemmatimonas sp.]